MADVKISALPPASVVNDADIIVLNQGGDTKTAAKSLVVAGLATTGQLSGLATTSQLSGYATTEQISGFTNTAQVSAIASTQIAAITPNSIGALSTSAASGFATTTQIVGLATTAQLSAFQNSAQVQALTTAQLSAISINAGTGLSGGGDLTTSRTLALTTTGVSALSYGSSAQVAALTIDAYGRITSASNIDINGAAPEKGGIEWTSATDYSAGDIVSYSGTQDAFVSQQGGNVNHSPIGDDGTWWKIVRADAVSLYGTPVNSEVAPLTSQGLVFDGSNWTSTPIANGWQPSFTYKIGNIVSYIGSLYVSLQENNSNENPEYESAWWQLAPQDAKSLKGFEVSSFPPLTSDVLTWDGTRWFPAAAVGLNSAQVEALTSSQIAAITPDSIGALSTDAASGFATTTDIQGIAFTSQLSAFTNSAQVEALASAQIAAITPGSIGAVATSDIIAISKGGTGSTDAVSALTALGAMSATQAAGGDLSGNLPNPTVAKLQGNAVTNVTPLDGQVLQYDTATSTWIAGAVPNGGSGGGGQMFFFNYNTAADAPTTGLPTTPTIVKELGRVSDTTGTSYTSGDLSQVGYDLIVHFVTDVIDPNVTAIPAGLFDFNFWASSNANAANQTIVQLKVFKYDGTTATLIATSDDISIYDPAVSAQYIASVVVPQTTVALNDRLYIQLLAKGTTNNRTITFDFGATKPSHVHTTIPSVGGSGLVKVINGVFQSPASKLLNEDVATNAAISLSKLAMSEVSVSAGAGLIGGGDLSTSRTLALATTGIAAISGAGSSVAVPVISANIYGQITALTTEAIAVGGLGTVTSIAMTSQVSGLSFTPTSAITSNGTFNLTGTLGIVGGGTGATDAPSALTSLGALSATATASGDLSGNYPGPTVAKIRGNTISATTPVSGQALVYNGTEWAPATSGTGTVTSVNTGTGLTGGPIIASGTIALETAGPGVITAGSSAAVPVITLDAYGRVSALTTAAISGGGGGGTGEGMQFAVVRHNTQVVPASAGTVNVSAWALNATTINFSATPSFTLVPGMVINLTGLNTIAIRTVVSPTQVILATGATAAGSATTNVTVQNTTATTFTVTAGALPTYDGKTLQVNDVVFLSAQGSTGATTPTAQNGPWIVTSLGATGVSAVFTRPSWFTGTISGPKQIGITGGIANYGYTLSIVGNIAGNTSYLVGVDPLISTVIVSRATFAVLNAQTFVGRQTFAANTTTVNPINFSSTAGQALLTTAALGAVEWDNQQMYVTSSTPAAGLTRNPIATAMLPINNQVASYTLVVPDAGKMIVVNSSSATTITIPLQATANSNFPIGTQILVMQTGSGQVTISPTDTVVLNGRSGLKTFGIYSVISLIKINSDSWVVAGDATV